MERVTSYYTAHNFINDEMSGAKRKIPTGAFN